MAFVLDVNLRIQDIIGLAKVESALSKVQGTTQAGGAAGTAAVVGGSVAGTSAVTGAAKAQASAANASAAAINKATVATNQLNTAQSKAVPSINKTTGGLKQAGLSAETFGQKMKLAGVRYGAFVAATAVPLAVIGIFGKATAAVIEFDTAILKLRQITGQTNEQIGGIRDTILDLATSTGTSATEIGRVAKVLAQAGQRGDQLTESLDALSKVPLTPSFETMDAAIEGTIAALNQFNSEGLTTTEVLDVLTALSNNFAASSEDIAKGISRGGAAFEAIGGTFREFAAVFTTIRQATRESAETVGTFMKTISSRLADPKIVNFLEGKGIRISEAIEAGNPVEAIKRIAAALQNTASIQDRIEIGTRLGGRRQISRLLALVSNIDVLNETLSTAGSSTGEFGKVAEEGLAGLQAQLNILVQEFNKLVQTLAAPLFVPIIQGVTAAGKALVTIVDVVKPVIPALTTIVGFAAGFKLLAISINSSAKALAFLSTVGVGGGLPGILSSFTGAAAGGQAGATARERVQRRLAGGVGGPGAAAAGGAGARLAGGATRAATAPLGQLALAAGLILSANKLSDSFEEAGNSAGVLASEFLSSVGILLAASSLLSGKSITGVFASAATLLGPWGTAIAAAVAALGAFTFAATKAVDIDVQNILDAAAKKVADTPVPTIEAGDTQGLQEAVGDLGLTAVIDGIQTSAERFDEGVSGSLASMVARVKNLFQGEGLITISDADAQKIIDDIVGTNPKLLNEILRASVEQFGVAGLEGGIDKLLAESLGGNLEVAGRVRQAIVKQLGGLNKIAEGIDQVQIDAKASQLANAIEKSQKDFASLRVPTKLAGELNLLSTVVGDVAKSIQNNVAIFDRLSQATGQEVGVAKLPTQFSDEAIRNLSADGLGIGELFPGLEGLTTDIAVVEKLLGEFGDSILASRAASDTLRSAFESGAVDPLDIINDFIDKFVSEIPEDISPEVESSFRAAASSLGSQLNSLVAESGGEIFNQEQLDKILNDVFKNNKAFADEAQKQIKNLLEGILQQINLGISTKEALAQADVGTAARPETQIRTLNNALAELGIETVADNFERGFGTIDDALVDVAQDGELVTQVLGRFQESSKEYADLTRKVTEALSDGSGASLELFESASNAATEMLNLKVALVELKNIARAAPQAFAKQQTEREKSGFSTGGQFAEEMVRILEKISQITPERIDRTRQFAEIEAAADAARSFVEPSVLFAEALEKSTIALKIFTSSLTQQDLERGAGALGARTTPEGRVFMERRPVQEARQNDQQRIVERNLLQSALFGGDIGRVLETLLQSGADIAQRQANLNLNTFGSPAETQRLKEIEGSLRNFQGFIFDIPKLIQESGLDPSEVAKITAKSLQEQAKTLPGGEVQNIGSLPQNRTLVDLTRSLITLIERPEVARRPEEISDQLSPTVQQLLQNLSRPIDRVPSPDDTPRVFEDLSASASDIQQAASETRASADLTAQSTESVRTASLDIATGGTDILNAGQAMNEAAGQLQAVADIQREALSGQQESAAGGVGVEGTREAMVATKDAVNSLGERVDAVAKAVDLQTQQAAELASIRQSDTLRVDGLEENTNAVANNSETANKTQEAVSTLNDGLSKVASAMGEGIGIDIDTASEIKVDVQGVANAAKEFTAEFEAIATNVAKKEIRIILQQLAAASGNSEAASTFESVV